eukprot:CAMPEP_0116131166 /NCGR_PEP_ID=MMETSP0329-20121206/8862_1 /TAXON_ID=697910 /ORGANISM="Pseudo-nitzschia arenysensis, Strain B593" /LENGTH=812 /DNA_ID=CAMNT_0003625581 /DNA_START=81 /DNA_END=2519 /DNA_ORIENTATION=-
MKVSTNALTLALALAMAGDFVSASSSSVENGLPAHHPSVRGTNPALAKFSNQLRCPYANEWLTKGAHKAAIDLGLTTPEKVAARDGNDEGQERRRHLQQASASAGVMAGCSFSNQWTGPSCMEFRGEGWTEATMEARCAAEQDSTLVMGEEGCPKPSELAGWCVKEASAGAIEATSMMISAMSDCGGNKMACESFVGGAFEAASGCGGGAPPSTGMGGGVPSEFANMGPPSGGDNKCMIAPGAIGAAHQSGFSKGYSNECAGTPAEGSPYMWPMAWSADVDTKSMAYGYDEVVHHNRGRTFYRLDKNWKRSDTTLALGVRRGIGQGPCENIDAEQSEEGLVACISDTDIAAGDPMTTMIHRGSLMYFITWKNSTDVKVGETNTSLISDCSYLDLMVIGNIRPDWFLDDRGDDTDVQYLGNQHIYYASGTPRLAKQWRKKDFASQYFTMSVAGNPLTKNSTDPIWPLVLNIPGEGFGDDMLQVYENHTLLTDEDDDLFDLVQNLEANGGSCPLVSSGLGPDGEGSEASFGPPTLEVHVPSNLEVDDNSWFTSVYTYSPVWQPPMKADDASGASAMGVAVTQKERVTVESCYDPNSKMVKLSVEYQDIEAIPTESGMQLPWMAIGYREDDICSMTPLSGADTKIIMISQAPKENFPKAYIGEMGPATKRFDGSAIGAIYQSLWPLDEAVGFKDVSLAAPMLGGVGGAMMSRSATPDGSVVLSFSQEFDERPEVMHLMYAIGMSTSLGVHTSRSCFDITEFPTCIASEEPVEESVPASSVQEASVETDSSASKAAVSAVFGSLAAFVGCLSLVFL